jgi:hypothetical protein
MALKSQRHLVALDVAFKPAGFGFGVRILPKIGI